VSKQLLLIDADGVAYRAAWTMEKTKYLAVTDDGKLHYLDTSKEAKSGPGAWTIWSRKELKDESEALMLTGLILKDIYERYPQREAVLWLSPSVGNFRDSLAKRAKYKGNRDAQPRPVHLKAIRAHLIDKYGALVAEGQEADDELGIGLTENPGAVCVSFDKDLRQIPGTHYDWVKKEEKVVGKAEGWMNFWVQVLAGDTVDNVPGIEGMGPVGARKILDGATGNKECWHRAVTVYKEKYGPDVGYTYALETARLVWVRRKRGVNFEAPV
jgi:DNA polymerase I